jgi:hypothetical protein
MVVVMRSDFLFATPSTLSGMARTLDLGAQFDSYNENPTGEIADLKALFVDWRVVGETLAAVLKRTSDEAEESREESQSLVRR